MKRAVNGLNNGQLLFLKAVNSQTLNFVLQWAASKLVNIHYMLFVRFLKFVRALSRLGYRLKLIDFGQFGLWDFTKVSPLVETISVLLTFLYFCAQFVMWKGIYLVHYEQFFFYFVIP